MIIIVKISPLQKIAAKVQQNISLSDSSFTTTAVFLWRSDFEKLDQSKFIVIYAHALHFNNQVKRENMNKKHTTHQ